MAPADIINLLIKYSNSYQNSANSVIPVIKTSNLELCNVLKRKRSLWRADVALKNIKKGPLIAEEDRVKFRSFEKGGEIRYAIDLVADRLDIILNEEED